MCTSNPPMGTTGGSNSLMKVLLVLLIMASGLLIFLGGLVAPKSQKISTQTIFEPIRVDNSTISNVVIDPEYSHAISRHPIEDVATIRKCMAEKGPYMSFKIDENRYLRTCIISEEEGLIGFQIVDIVDRIAKEKTAYIKDRIKNVHQLLEYIAEKGYSRYLGPI